MTHREIINADPYLLDPTTEIDLETLANSIKPAAKTGK